jgi:hypothetical protein
MEQLPCELIIVDTSGDAKVHELLLEYTDQVVLFDWCNDFAKARNAGLERAKGEWFLYLDDDEWVADATELIRFFQSGNYKKYGCANYIVRNFHDPDYMHYSDGWASRMIRIGKHTRFRSKIHEYLYPQEGEGINLHMIVNHSGYIYQTKADKERHFNRNYPLLLAMMEEEPERLRWRVQIVQELYTVDKWEEMRRFCEESLVLTKDRTDEWDSRDIGTFYAGQMEGCFKCREYAAALDVSAAALGDRRTSPLCHAYLAQLMARCHYALENYEQTDRCLDQYFALKEELEKDQRSLEKEQGALLVDGAFDEMSLKRAYSLRIANALRQNDTKPLRQLFDKLEWDQKVIYVSDEIFPALMEGMATLPQEPVFIKTMQQMWNNHELQKRMFPAIEAWKARDEGGYERLLRIAAQVDGDHWYLWYCKILVAGWDQDAEQVAVSFREFCNRTPDLFATPEEILAILKKYGISPEEGYLSVPLEQWAQQLTDYLEKVPFKDILLTQVELDEMKTREDIRYEYAFLQLAKARALHSVDQKKFDTKRTCLLDFAKLGSAFAGRYFSEAVLEEWTELLPEYLQAALLLHNALDTEERDVKQAAALERQAAEAYPALAKAVLSYQRAYQYEVAHRKTRARDELGELEKKIQEQVRQCVADHRYREALEILAQLRQLKPDDLGVAELSLQVRLKQLEEETVNEQ